jgi:signal transduction histidine kinase
MKLTIKKKLAISYLTILIFILLIMSFSIYSMDKIQSDTSRIMTKTMSIDKFSSNIYLSMINQQTGVRGYFITGDEKFLVPYYIGLEQVKAELRNMDDHKHVHQDIEKLIAEIKPQIFSIQEYFSVTVSLCRAGKLDDVRARIDLGKTLFDKFIDTYNSLQEEIMELNAQAAVEMEYAKSRQKLFLVISGLLVLANAILLLYKLSSWIIKDFEHKNNANRELEKLLKAQEEFLANVSHEFKTPLNVIFSSIQLLDFYNKNDLLAENKHNLTKYMGTIIQNCYRLTRLVNNIIDASKLESGFFNLNMKTVNIVSVVENITLSVAQYVEARGLKLTFDTDMEERLVSCDPHAVERIILNLISNSVKFTNYGDEIEVYISEAQENVSITVKDTGVGIDAEHLPDIFQKFKQIDKSFTRNREGSGIGLYLVKKLVEMQNGQIKVESIKGRGTEFIIDFPVENSDESGNIENDNKLNSRIEMIEAEFADIYEA